MQINKKIREKGRTLSFSLMSLSIGMYFIYIFFFSIINGIIPNADWVWGAIIFVANFFIMFTSIRNETNNIILLSRLSLCLVILFCYVTLGNQNLMHGQLGSTLLHVSALFLIIFLKNIERWIDVATTIIWRLSWFHLITGIAFSFVKEVQIKYIVPLLNRGIDRERGLISQIYNGYLTGITHHYSTFATYLSIGFLLANSRFFISDTKSRKSGVATLLFAIGVGMSGKRAHLLFCIATAIFTYIFLDRSGYKTNKLRKVIIALFILIVLFVLMQTLPIFQTSFNRIMGESDDVKNDITNGRGYFWNFAWQEFMKRPITGSGWGSFRYAYYESIYGMTGMTTDAHNVYIQLLYEIGIVGFLLVCTLFIASFISTYRLYKALNLSAEFTQKDKSYLHFSIAYQLFFLLYCFTGNPLYDAITFLPYIFACAIPITIKQRKKSVDQRVPATRERNPN